MHVHRKPARAEVRTTRPLRLLAVLGVVVIGLIAAIGSGSSSTSSKPVDSSGKKANAVAHVGDTIAVDDGADQKGQVTLNEVIDPAQGDTQFDSPDAGKRFVAVKLTIKNTGTKNLTDDVFTTSSVKGSDNQSYSPSFSSIKGCTTFNNGSYTLAPNESVTGCATFEIPTSVKVAQFNYEPTFAIGGTNGQWLVP